jgi:hypothetical protein
MADDAGGRDYEDFLEAEESRLERDLSGLRRRYGHLPIYVPALEHELQGALLSMD